ncbi:hypothetical protein L596_007185 [Steinernema carpocapsae]|uniref:Uncharacterized protein n=1 Tax=Steinernema carpocapsae TaxID=34508 RepID=A0A4V6A5X7_STECR|nr:hypothetical protein L596_007185 [Steinernema carpocapsae]
MGRTNRFHAQQVLQEDKWYKARITKPEMIPQLHVIEPEKYYRSLEERLNVAESDTIDIGFKRRSVTKQNVQKDEAAMEKLSRKNELLINLESLELNDLSIFNHYNIMDDLFKPGVSSTAPRKWMCVSAKQLTCVMAIASRHL